MSFDLAGVFWAAVGFLLAVLLIVPEEFLDVNGAPFVGSLAILISSFAIALFRFTQAHRSASKFRAN